MNEGIKEIIKRIYLNNDYDFFRIKCKVALDLPSRFYSTLEECSTSIIEEFDNICPSKRWYIQFRDVVKGEFKVSYKTMLQISKILPLFYIQHEFEVDNKDDNRVSPVLDGFGGQPYTKNQFEFEERISKILLGAGYKQLSLAEMNEVIPEVSFDKEGGIFGNQITVEYALFNDCLELCPESE